MSYRRQADISHFHDKVFTDMVVARDQFGRRVAYIKEEHYNGAHVYSQPIPDIIITEETVSYLKMLAGTSTFRILIVNDDGSIRIETSEEKEEAYA